MGERERVKAEQDEKAATRKEEEAKEAAAAAAAAEQQAIEEKEKREEREAQERAAASAERRRNEESKKQQEAADARARAERWTRITAITYLIGTIAVLFIVHASIFFIFGRMSSSFAEQLMLILEAEQSRPLVSLAAVLFTVVGAQWLWPYPVFWVLVAAAGYLVFFEVAPGVVIKKKKFD